MKIFLFTFGLFIFLLTSCNLEQQGEQTQAMTSPQSNINEAAIQKAIDQLIEKYGDEHSFRIEQGVKNVASFWRESDGTTEDFHAFCTMSFVSSADELEQAFNIISRNAEVIGGLFNKMSLELQRPLHLDTGPLHELDFMYGSYSPSSHLDEDLFQNTIAFYILLNFPHYSVDEKNANSENWTRQDWAFAKAGDMFSSRIPPEILQRYSLINSESSKYIDEYNIYMGKVVDAEGKTYFPEDMKLISHWNLRDELKSQYAYNDGLFKQELLYNVMLRIIRQELPQAVINKGDYNWNPLTNELLKDGVVQEFEPEPNTRYKHLLNNFQVLREMDAYCPTYPTYISRKFEEDMQMSYEMVEDLFVEYLSSPVALEVGKLISQRLGRELKPYDIWYDGFKARSAISEESLTAITSQKYPSAQALESGLEEILIRLGFRTERAKHLADKITVEAARGAGHAWGAQMRGEKAHLRSRLPKGGVDYKGFNIAMHELGHNVEQTFSLYDVDHYLLNGVPNTAFTEAMAFIFQRRDLQVLGIGGETEETYYLNALDNFWSTFEIIGVALIDMRVWKWMYENPNLTDVELREKVIEIAGDVWNQFYAPIYGVQDIPLLAIYSHSISYPLYLSAYPLGHIIEFQIEEYLPGKHFGDEIERMCAIGTVTPHEWMMTAVGAPLSVQPLVNAARRGAEKFLQ